MDAQYRQSYDAIQIFKVDKQRAVIRSVLLFERWSLRIHEVIVFGRTIGDELALPEPRVHLNPRLKTGTKSTSSYSV